LVIPCTVAVKCGLFSVAKVTLDLGAEASFELKIYPFKSKACCGLCLLVVKRG